MAPKVRMSSEPGGEFFIVIEVVFVFAITV